MKVNMQDVCNEAIEKAKGNHFPEDAYTLSEIRLGLKDLFRKYHEALERSITKLNDKVANRTVPFFDSAKRVGINGCERLSNGYKVTIRFSGINMTAQEVPFVLRDDGNLCLYETPNALNTALLSAYGNEIKTYIEREIDYQKFVTSVDIGSYAHIMCIDSEVRFMCDAFKVTVKFDTEAGDVYIENRIYETQVTTICKAFSDAKYINENIKDIMNAFAVSVYVLPEELIKSCQANREHALEMEKIENERRARALKIKNFFKFGKKKSN